MSGFLRDRERHFRAIAERQSGIVPYDNLRKMGVKGAQDGIRLHDFLSRLSGWTSEQERNNKYDAGHVHVDGVRKPLHSLLRAGMQVEVLFKNVVEPAVAGDIRILFEDDELMVLVKPAPLPVHPSGRYNKHSLTEIAKIAWPDIALKPVHRLDASTGGLLVLGKNAKSATSLVQAFSRQQVEKKYAARVVGRASSPSFSVDLPITKSPGLAGTRGIDSSGSTARTDFEEKVDLQDGTSVLWCYPRTGRTNQIRVHLQSEHLPIVGDRAYGTGMQAGDGFADSEDRLFLFACGLEFTHPVSREHMTFQIDVPSWFETPQMNPV